MVREIVQLHGGHVSVADGPEGGACFRMTLPPVRKS
jgi:signal transduction histidine kinase